MAVTLIRFDFMTKVSQSLKILSGLTLILKEAEKINKINFNDVMKKKFYFDENLLLFLRFFL